VNGLHYREVQSEEVGAVPPFRRDHVVVGASAGGVEVLRTVASALPVEEATPP